MLPQAIGCVALSASQQWRANPGVTTPFRQSWFGNPGLNEQVCNTTVQSGTININIVGAATEPLRHAAGICMVGPVR
jgi:hypothetical protein